MLLGVVLLERSFLHLVTESFLFFSQLLLEFLVRPPDRLDLEELVDRLQWDTTGLGDEEEGEEPGKEGQRCEEEVHAVVHRGEHLLGEARDKEVEEPVAGRGAGLRQRTDVGIEEFLFTNS